MEYGAIDLHKKESQIRIVMEGGESSTDRSRRRVERLTTLFWSRPRMRISLVIPRRQRTPLRFSQGI